MYGTFLSSHNKGRCKRIARGDVSACRVPKSALLLRGMGLWESTDSKDEDFGCTAIELNSYLAWNV